MPKTKAELEATLANAEKLAAEGKISSTAHPGKKSAIETIRENVKAELAKLK